MFTTSFTWHLAAACEGAQQDSQDEKIDLAERLGVVALLNRQGEASLDDEVRQFVKTLPSVLTDRVRITGEFIRHMKIQRTIFTQCLDIARGKTLKKCGDGLDTASPKNIFLRDAIFKI